MPLSWHASSLVPFVDGRIREKQCMRHPWARRVRATRYMNQNPVKRRLVEKPEDWPWSSWRFHYLEDASILAMDRMT